MFKHNANSPLRSPIAASSLLLSATAFAAGGGGSDGDDGCTSNCGFERGPDPTVSFLEASTGPYSVRTDSGPNHESDWNISEYRGTCPY